MRSALPFVLFRLFVVLNSLCNKRCFATASLTKEDQQHVDQQIRGSSNDTPALQSQRVLGGLGDRCGAGFECDSGFSCEPGINICFHSPRLENQPCSLGYGCAGGLHCASVGSNALECVSLDYQADFDTEDFDQAYSGESQVNYDNAYIGCFADDRDRALPVKKGSGKTVEECAEACSEYEYFGRQWKGQCWCGNYNYARYGRATGCDCKGSNVGGWKQCVYRAQYLGCFADNAERALPVKKGNGKSVDECAEACSNFKFYGRQWSGQCWCGNGHYNKYGPSSECDCEGEYVGAWKQCVYSNLYATEVPSTAPSASPSVAPSALPSISFSPTASPSSLPTTEPTASPAYAPSASPTSKPSFSPTSEPTSIPTLLPTSTPTSDPTTAYTSKYLGCFGDATDRALPIYKGSGMAVYECALACKKFNYFARQWKGQCWCGNSNYDKHGEASGCDCEGKNVGSWKQCVYQEHKSNYVGCFADKWERTLPIYKDSGKSVIECAKACSGYQFFGRQWRGQCWCGDNCYDKYGEADGCDCDGSNVGAWKQCVYRNDLKLFDPANE